MRTPSLDRRAVLEAAARRYDGAGTATRRYVHGKLRGDPVYLALLDGGDLPRRGRLLDLGCGHGIALALLAAARGSDGAPDLELIGIERSPRRVKAARAALGGDAEIRRTDLVAAELPSCDAAVLLDVLHYLDAAEQEALLDRAARALAPGGVLLIREADAARGLRFALTRLQERLAALGRGHWRQRFHYRSAADWERLLADRGLDTTTRPSWRGTPFANVLIVARLRNQSRTVNDMLRHQVEIPAEEEERRIRAPVGQPDPTAEPAPRTGSSPPRTRPRRRS